jgi:CBS domain-containing protein
MTTVKHILDTKGRRVHSISPDAFVFDALKMMAEKNIGSLVVMEHGKLLGIVTERTYAREIALKGRTSSQTLVRDIMSTNLICVRPENSVEDCMAVMTKKTVRHLPVVEHGKIVGIVSIGDMVNSIIKDQEFIIDQLEHYIQGHKA